MANDMNLMLRIRVNADGTAQALNGTQVAVQRIGTEADNANAQVGDYSTAMYHGFRDRRWRVLRPWIIR